MHPNTGTAGFHSAILEVRYRVYVETLPTLQEQIKSIQNTGCLAQW
jgi:hypothetical protein